MPKEKHTYNIAYTIKEYPGETLQLIFPPSSEDKRYDNGDAHGAPTYGVVVMESLLRANYKQVTFNFELDKYNEYEYIGFYNVLKIKGDVQILCAIHQMCQAPIFYITDYSHPCNAIREKLVSQWRTKIIDGKVAPVDAAFVKQIMVEAYADNYDLLKNKLRSKFLELNLAPPPIIETCITSIDALQDAEIEFNFPKTNILLAKICEQRSSLATNKKNKLYKKTIEAYDKFLAIYGYDTIEKQQQYLIEYAQYEEAIEAALQKRPAPPAPALPSVSLKVQLQTSIQILNQKIDQMKQYGDCLPMGQQLGVNIIVSDIKGMVEKFFKQEDEKLRQGFPDFQRQLLLKLKESKPYISDYRVNWETILKNVAIALTGIGTLILAGKLIYSKISEGRALFFFQQEKTTREKHVDGIENVVNGMRLAR